MKYIETTRLMQRCNQVNAAVLAYEKKLMAKHGHIPPFDLALTLYSCSIARTMTLPHHEKMPGPGSPALYALGSRG